MSATISIQELPYQDRADFAIPEGSIDRWTKIHPDAGLAILLTRDDLDRFFFMHMQIGACLSHLQQAVIDLSNGELAKAQLAMSESQRLNLVQLGNVRAFMTSIMERAHPFQEPVHVE